MCGVFIPDRVMAGRQAVILHPPAYEDGTDSVPKRRLLELRRR